MSYCSHAPCPQACRALPHPARLCLMLLCLAVLGIFCLPEFANAQQGYPQPRDPWLNDFADVVTPADAAALRETLAGLKAAQGIELAVVTIGSINDYPAGAATFEQFATGLFNAWGIGDSSRNDGVLILVAVRDRRVRIETGDGYGHSLNDSMQEVIDTRMTPHFRNGHYSLGILEGARAVRDVLAQSANAAPANAAPDPLAPLAPQPAAPPPALPKPEATPLPAEMPPGAAPPPPRAQTQFQPPLPPPPIPFQRPATRMHFDAPLRHHAVFHTIHPLVPLVAGGALLIVLILGASIYMRRRPRRCPHCHGEMQRLDETSDDRFLEAGQKLEERLGSIDYDVWQCPRCNTHTIEPYTAWFSSYKACPQCGLRAMQSSSEILMQPTYLTHGEQRLSKDCRNCAYHDERIVLLPMLVRHDDTSSSFHASHSSGSSLSGGGGGGSFGGGHSSGGGASGSW